MFRSGSRSGLKRWLTWANLLTAIRAVILVPTCYAILNQAWIIATLLFTTAVVTDIFDGKVARRLNQTSPFGGLFDHATDAAFVSLCCWAFANQGTINMVLPALIILAFIQYMLDSKALAGVALRMSAIGRSNGIAYYILVGTLIGAETLNWQWLLQIAGYVAWLLVLTSGLSMLDRGVTLLRQPGKH
jgi:phosphatidylglycerophosphate synthase